METEKLELLDGKYTLKLNPDYSFTADRYGEPWRDMTGDGMIFAMFQRIKNLEDKVDTIHNYLVNVTIVDPMKVVQDLLSIITTKEED